jgi:(2Fe-2S) ferredoxin
VGHIEESVVSASDVKEMVDDALQEGRKVTEENLKWSPAARPPGKTVDF